MAKRRKRADFRFIDLFAGIGGMRRAFEAAGGECVFTSEWNRFAVETYVANFRPAHEVRGDITAIAASEIPGHDVLVAGFPCQPFSIAGVSKKNALGRHHGFKDETQGTLFFDIARIIDERRPAAFLLENVKNLASHDRGRTMDVILRTLEDELGYAVSWGVIDARHWVPQHRERTFIVGFRDRPRFDFASIPRPGNAAPLLFDVLHSPEFSEGFREKPEERFTEKARAVALDRYTLTTHLWDYLRAYAEKHKAAGNGFGCSKVGPFETARTLSARYFKDGSEILIDRGRGRNPRRLTPRECARLMGFDDRRTDVARRFKIPVSDVQAYKQFGNSVAVPAVSAVAAAMINHLNAVAVPLAPPHAIPVTQPRSAARALQRYLPNLAVA